MNTIILYLKGKHVPLSEFYSENQCKTTCYLIFFFQPVNCICDICLMKPIVLESVLRM